MRLDQVKILVLDEVDRMLDMGFQPAIARIAAMLPSERQTLCYSATLEGSVRDVAQKYLDQPVRIEIGSVLKPTEQVELRSFEVAHEKKQELLEHLLSEEKGSFLVFVRTKHGADRVARRLTRSGWSATQIHGDRTQSQRNSALRSFSEGRHRVLVATDVAARGIDVANVAQVVNFDLPKVPEDFVHRVGRTGRASALAWLQPLPSRKSAASAQDREDAFDPDEALPGERSGRKRGVGAGFAGVARLPKGWGTGLRMRRNSELAKTNGQPKRAALLFAAVVSHPFAKMRRKDGARGYGSGGIASWLRRMGNPSGLPFCLLLWFPTLSPKCGERMGHGAGNPDGHFVRLTRACVRGYVEALRLFDSSQNQNRYNCAHPRPVVCCI